MKCSAVGTHETVCHCAKTRIGHRQQQEEIKARLQERRVRKVTRKRKQPEETGDPEMEKMMQQLEDRLGSVINSHDSAVEQLKTQLDQHRQAKLEELKEQVRQRVLEEHAQDVAATQKEAESLDSFDAETSRQMESIKKDFEAKAKELEASGAPGEHVEQLKAEMKIAMEEFQSKRSKDRESYVKSTQERQMKRLEAIKQKEAAEEKERLEKLEQAKRKEIESKLKLEEIRAKERDANETEIAQIRSDFQEHSKQLTKSLENTKNKRREMLEQRLAVRRNAVAKATEKKTDDLDTLVTSGTDKDEAAVQAKLEKLKEEARRQREALEANLKQSKQSQRAKLLERQRKRKAAAMEKKEKVLQEKEREAAEVERKVCVY